MTNQKIIYTDKITLSSLNRLIKLGYKVVITTNNKGQVK